jgi:alginate O-acetyltransferase complex protein AlgI
MLGLLKLLQLDFDPRWAAHHPLWHGLSPFDVSKARRVDTRFDARLFVLLLEHAILLVAVVVGLVRLPAETTPLRGAWRLLLGAALVYTAMETATEGLRFLHRLFAVEVPPIQQAPILSRSVGEFWSRRWNRPVSDWLNEYVFLPLARRRRPLLALLSAFAVSALFHAWLYFVALGWPAAASVAVFFLLQAPVVMLETKWRISRWPAVAARAWTLAWLLASSPLFVEPILRGLGSR